MTVFVIRRQTLDAVLKMATAAAQKHADALPDDRKANSELSQAIAATWELVGGRRGSAEAVALDGLIAKVVGKPLRAKEGRVMRTEMNAVEVRDTPCNGVVVDSLELLKFHKWSTNGQTNRITN